MEEKKTAFKYNLKYFYNAIKSYIVTIPTYCISIAGLIKTLLFLNKLLDRYAVRYFSWIGKHALILHWFLRVVFKKTYNKVLSINIKVNT